MIRDRKILLNFVELCQLDRDERTLLSVDEMRLEGRIELIERHRSRRRAERLEELERDLLVGRAQFEAFEILGLAELARPRGELSKADVPDVLETVDVAFRHRRPDVAADLTVV